MQGNALATIHQELIALAPKFEIQIHDGVSAHVSMRLLSLTDRLKIEVSDGEDLLAHGDIFHHEYDIERAGRDVAHISKKWVSLVDSYGIDISDDQNQLLLLCCAVVIDAILDLREREEHRH